MAGRHAVTSPSYQRWPRSTDCVTLWQETWWHLGQQPPGHTSAHFHLTRTLCLRGAGEGAACPSLLRAVLVPPSPHLSASVLTLSCQTHQDELQRR